MAIHICHQSGKTKLNSVDSKEDLKIQYIPCKIEADCKAGIESYFTPYIRTEDDTNFSASFRGHSLNGKKITLPNGYRGIVLHERVRPDTDKEDRKFFITQDFDSFMYWNYDKMPSKNDSILKAVDDWIELAEALHSPIIEG